MRHGVSGRRKGLSAKTLIVSGDLARAIRRESNQAVAHWFGVTPQTVTVWRKALGVGRTNPVTHRLRSDYTAEPWAKAARLQAYAKAGDPARRRKIAAAKRGKARPRKHMASAWRANTGRVPTAATRAKMSAAAKERAKTFLPGGRPWTPEEDELVRTLPPSEAAARTGRSVRGVWDRRRRLGLPDGRTRFERVRTAR